MLRKYKIYRNILLKLKLLPPSIVQHKSSYWSLLTNLLSPELVWKMCEIDMVSDWQVESKWITLWAGLYERHLSWLVKVSGLYTDSYAVGRMLPVLITNKGYQEPEIKRYYQNTKSFHQFYSIINLRSCILFAHNSSIVSP